MAKPTKMIKEEAATEMVSEAPVQQVVKKSHRAKVNMTLPGGKQLVAGQSVDLSEDELEHLKKSFKSEDHKHIWE